MAFNFSDKIVNPSENSVLIVDALNLAFRWKHQGRTDFRYDYIETVKSLARSYECSRIIIASDWGSSSYRKEISPEYKQARKEKFKEQTDEEKAAFEEFFEEFESTLELLKESFEVLRFRGVEADDIAAHLVKYKEEYGFEKIWLISSDRDWDLLIQENVGRFSYVTRKEVTLDNWGDHYECTPEEYISFKCLTGDKGDNVPGIAGIGPKRAIGLINQYGSALDIYDACPLPGKYKYIETLNDNCEQLVENYQLMDLISFCDDAIGEENIKKVKDTLLTGDSL